MEGRTYRYFRGEPLYPFGYGLSYTRFSYANLRIPERVGTGADLKVSVEVTNAGERAGEEVMQLYLSHRGAEESVPIRSLEGFERVALRPGEKKVVEFTLSARQLSTIGADNRRVVEPGAVEISIGGKQPGFSGAADAATTQVLTGRTRLAGQPKYVD